MWNLKYGTNEHIDDIETHTEKICGGQGGGVMGEGKDWEFGTDRCKLLYAEWIKKALLYSTGNNIQYPVINHNGEEYEIYTLLYSVN